ncbi:MAG TPA: helix-turn-helix transcriptional regulator [Baekduia sp.]|jgi:DNA-binding CsgD family transcriptional regulator
MARLDLHRLDRELDALASRGLGSHSFRHEAMARLRHVVPVDAYCFSAADPSSLAMTATASDGVDRSRAPLVWHNEHRQPDVAKHADLAAGRRPVRVLAEELRGDLERSPRYRELLRPMGVEHELRAAAIEDGSTWGFVHLFRGRGRKGFDADEVATVSAVMRHLAAGVRAAELAPVATVASAQDAPSLVLLAGDDTIALASGAARHWLRRLADPDVAQRQVPEILVVLASWARALASRSDDDVAQARVRSDDGRWWLLHASCADGGGSPEEGASQVAIIVQPAGGPDLAPLLLRSFGLNAGERAVTELVLQGRSTREIAELLVISPWTVQDRLKQVFAKAQVGSRRELVARVNPAR